MECKDFKMKFKFNEKLNTRIVFGRTFDSDLIFMLVGSKNELEKSELEYFKIKQHIYIRNYNT